MVKHIDHIKAKSSNRLNLFRCIAGTEYGADRKTLLYLYKTLILPIIDYGSVVYAGASDNTLKKLDTIQNSFIIIALGVMKTSPISSLQVEAFSIHNTSPFTPNGTILALHMQSPLSAPP